MSKLEFKGNFTQQEAIPDAAIERAVEVLRHGRLHRYNVVPGEISETSALEQEYAAWQGARYCLACASGGYAMHVALRAWGIVHGEPVLTNAFTLSPVPGAIDNAGARPVFVESTRDLVIDLADLEHKIVTSGARLLLLSHMRGHLADMDALCALLREHGVTLIEDCAHTMGASWNGTRSGQFGIAACFSTQTYKHLNSGEGGFVTTDDAALMARAIMLSGSYMLYERHGAAPDPSEFAEIRLDTPNYSGRMDNLRAAILRPQLQRLEQNCERWNARYRALESALGEVQGLSVPRRPAAEVYVGSSFQFLVKADSGVAVPALIDACLAAGVELKWFGAPEPSAYTSRYDSWRYAPAQMLPATDAILDGLCDLRIPLTFSVEDCALIGVIIRERFETLRAAPARQAG